MTCGLPSLAGRVRAIAIPLLKARHSSPREMSIVAAGCATA